MFLNVRILRFGMNMYVFFYKNGPTFISQHIVKMKIVQETIHENFLFSNFFHLNSKFI